MTEPKFNLCACMGLVGTDPYCPCEMRRRGLKSDSEWTEEDKARFTKALGDMFGWEEQQGEQNEK